MEISKQVVQSYLVSGMILNELFKSQHLILNVYFLCRSSSIFRRMLRLSDNNDKENESKKSPSASKVIKKRRKFGRSRRARRAELEAAILKSGQGIGNKSFIGSTSTVNQHFKRIGVLNSSQKSRVSSL